MRSGKLNAHHFLFIVGDHKPSLETLEALSLALMSEDFDMLILRIHLNNPLGSESQLATQWVSMSRLHHRQPIRSTTNWYTVLILHHKQLWQLRMSCAVSKSEIKRFLGGTQNLHLSPMPVTSHHPDYYPLLGNPQAKPLFATIASWVRGVDPTFSDTAQLA